MKSNDKIVKKKYWVTEDGEVAGMFSRYGQANNFYQDETNQSGRILLKHPDGKFTVYGSSKKPKSIKEMA